MGGKQNICATEYLVHWKDLHGNQSPISPIIAKVSSKLWETDILEDMWFVLTTDDHTFYNNLTTYDKIGLCGQMPPFPHLPIAHYPQF